jgi:hypothetical protein
VSARAALALAAVALLSLAPARSETRAAAFARIVRTAPRGATERAEWLRGEAQRTPDGRLAFELMEEVTRRAPAEAAAPARLWIARFWMAAGKPEQAALELRLLGRIDPQAPWADEAAYWRTLLGLEESPAVSDAESVPPWGIMARIAALRFGDAEGGRARTGLALEGAVRRAGLLGVWLWALSRSGEPARQRSVRETLAGSARSLAAAPERVALGAAVGP